MVTKSIRHWREVSVKDENNRNSEVQQAPDEDTNLLRPQPSHGFMQTGSRADHNGELTWRGDPVPIRYCTVTILVLVTINLFLFALILLSGAEAALFVTYLVVYILLLLSGFFSSGKESDISAWALTRVSIPASTRNCGRGRGSPIASYRRHCNVGRTTIWCPHQQDEHIRQLERGHQSIFAARLNGGCYTRSRPNILRHRTTILRRTQSAVPARIAPRHAFPRSFGFPFRSTKQGGRALAVFIGLAADYNWASGASYQH